MWKLKSAFNDLRLKANGHKAGYIKYSNYTVIMIHKMTNMIMFVFNNTIWIHCHNGLSKSTIAYSKLFLFDSFSLTTQQLCRAPASLSAAENISYSCMKLNFMKNRKLLMIFKFGSIIEMLIFILGII